MKIVRIVFLCMALYGNTVAMQQTIISSVESLLVAVKENNTISNKTYTLSPCCIAEYMRYSINNRTQPTESEVTFYVTELCDHSRRYNELVSVIIEHAKNATPMTILDHVRLEYFKSADAILVGGKMDVERIEKNRCCRTAWSVASVSGAVLTFSLFVVFAYLN